jgi:lipoprotein-anchoring transpeptidase ErfK/SrfK
VLHLARRMLGGLAIVLIVGSTGFVLRGVLPSPDARGALGALPAKPAKPSEFSRSSLASRAVPRGASLIAVSKRRTSIRVYRRGRDGRSRTLRARKFEGHRLPMRFMVVAKKRGWVKVQVPGGASRWVRRRSVTLSHTPYKLVVQRKRHRLLLLRNGRIAKRFRIAIGAGITPTPAGRYYVTDLIRSTDPFYGPYAFGLSARTREQLGIHGTDQPGSIGSDVSRGCIRVHNGVIKRLAKIVPIGTPVVIR